MLLSIFWLLLWTSYVQALGPAMNTDNISKTCSSEQARIITRALNDVDELIKATFPVTGSKDVFIKYFGTGWAVGDQNHILNNYQAARNLLRDKTGGSKVWLGCKDDDGTCKTPGVMAYVSRTFPLNMVFCPGYFSFKHLTDLAKQKPTTNLWDLRTFEHFLLHEMFHVYPATYYTAFNTRSTFPERPTDHHIGDMVLTIPGYGKTAAYGWEKCSAYAQSRAPPKFISANSDSYTWLATDAYFSQIWKTSFPRDEPEPSGDSEDIPDNDDTVVAPDQVCEAQGAPAQDDCSTLLLSIPDSADPIDPTKAGGCYTRDGTSYKWCDLYTAYSCQVTVGWDTSENGGTNPLTTGKVLRSMLQSTLDNAGENPCSKGNTLPSGGVVPGYSASSGTPWQFCLKRVGYDCIYQH